MKKLIILICGLLICAVASAQMLDPQRGYRGFVESESYFFPDLSFMSGEGGGSSDFWTGVSTSHGYQLNPHLYVGAGMSCVWILSDRDNYHSTAKVKYLPLYANLRTDLRFGEFTPFADLRMGWNMLHNGSFSGALTLGYRINWGKPVSLNIAIGVNMRGYREKDYDSGWNEEEGPWSRPNGKYRTGNDVLPTIRLGVEF